MEKLSQSLSELVIEACKHPPGSRERQRNLTTIIRLISDRLWQENTSYYEDALQETWIYFCRNICAGCSDKAYDPSKASVITWLNNYLKWRLKDGYIRTEKQKRLTVPSNIDRYNQVVNPIDRLPAKQSASPLLEELEKWVLADPHNKLSKIYLEKHPQITARALILSRLPPETPWKTLAAQYNVASGTLSSFYQRKCKPLLREFSKFQGYI